MAPEMNCIQCLNPDAKGLHTCGRDQPKKSLTLRQLEDYAIRAFQHAGYDAGRFRDGTPFSTAPKKCQEVVNAFISFVAEEHVGLKSMKEEREQAAQARELLAKFREDLFALREKKLPFEEWDHEVKKLVKKYSG